MSYIRKSFSGNAVATTVTANISGTDVTIQVGATTGFPNTANGPFVVTIDRGTTNEEKVLISSYTTTTLTVSQRGYDGTTGISHSSGADLRHTIDANTIGEHEAALSQMGTVTPSTSAVGDAATDGTSLIPAPGDHKHARESFAIGAVSSSAPGDTENDGTSGVPSRADHKHARETDAQLLTAIQSQFTAAGDLIVGTGTGSGELLHAGPTGTALRSNGTTAVPSWEAATTAAGTLGTDYTTTGTFATFLTTASLGVGTWRVTFNGYLAIAGGQTADVKIAQGSATATFAGPVITGNLVTGASTFTTIVTVTAAGTLVFQAQGTGGAVIKAASPVTATAGITGYTAVQQ